MIFGRNKIDVNSRFVHVCGQGDLSAARKYVKKGANIRVWNDYALKWAAHNGRLEIVKYLVDQGAGIHVSNDYALRWAAHNGHLEVVKYLVEQGAYIHAVNDEALRFAAFNGHLQIVNALRKAAGDAYKCHKCIIRSTCLELCDDFWQKQNRC